MPPKPAAPAPLPRLSLILGGVRSGKSRYGEALIEASGLLPVYLATAEALDDEMRARIARHRERRSDRWRTVEEPLALADALADACRAGSAVLVDCLTLWLTNLMVHGRDIEAETEHLLACLDRLDGAVVFVANEVGLGVVPINAMARAFVDHAGLLHQRLAARADRVVLMTAGLSRQLKP